MKYILLVICFSVLVNSAFAQQGYEVSIKTATESDLEGYNAAAGMRIKKEQITTMQLSKAAGNLPLKSVPNLCETYAISYLTMNWEQYIYDGYLNKEYTRRQWDEYKTMYGIDTTLLVSASGVKNIFYLYVGVDKEKGEKYVVVDTNANLDFSDDKLYRFPLADYSLDTKDRMEKSQHIEIQVSDSLNIPLFLNPFISYQNTNGLSEDEKLLQVTFFNRVFMQGKVTINGQDIYVTANEYNLLQQQINKRRPFDFSFVENDRLENIVARIGDTLTVAERKIYVEKAIGNDLYLKDLGGSCDSSRVGSYFPDLYASSLSGDKVHLNELMKDKFVFIDFWGSWCGPCIAAIPELKELYGKLKDRDDILILGIALEHKEDVDKLKKIIKDKDIEWFNVWNDFSTRKLQNSVHGKLHVDNFPTYMIIDKNGKIVFKEINGLNIFQQASDFFMNLIDEK